MAIEYTSASAPGSGIVRRMTTHVMNRTGATRAVGDLVALDLGADAAETLAGQGVAGATNLAVVEAGFHNVVGAPVQTLNSGCLYCVVSRLLDGGGADNTEMEVALSGAFPAAMGGSGLPRRTLLRRDPGSPTRLSALTNAAGMRPLGMLLEPSAVSGVTQLVKTLFFGASGLYGGASGDT